MTSMATCIRYVYKLDYFNTMPDSASHYACAGNASMHIAWYCEFQSKKHWSMSSDCFKTTVAIQ